MFHKNKMQLQKPVYTTSSITRTENTITTANGLMKTTRTVQTYEASYSSSRGSSNFPSLAKERLSSPKLRSAFDEPLGTYGTKIPSSASALKSTSFPKLEPLRPPLKFNLSKYEPLESKPLFPKQPQPLKLLPAATVRSEPPKLGAAPNVFNNELNEQLRVAVKATGVRHDVHDKVPTYQTHSPRRRGRLLLINNIEFNKKRRDGADVDQRNIVALFQKIGFDVFEHKNKKKSEIQRIVTNFAADRDLKKCDICITVIMSHGNIVGEQTIIQTIDEQALETEWVVQQFDGVNCVNMVGKPKIFIFQCCRGENEHANVQTDAVVFQKPRQVQDILISYSTVPGFVAYRDPKLGSWYIQGLCKVFMEHAHDTHIEDLLKIVDAELAKLNVSSQRQTSSYENRGFQRCYLHPIKK